MSCIPTPCNTLHATSWNRQDGASCGRNSMQYLQVVCPCSVLALAARLPAHLPRQGPLAALLRLLEGARLHVLVQVPMHIEAS